MRDLDNKRRYGTLEDLQNFVKLAYMTPNIHHSGGVICEPVDVPVPKRHLDIVYSHIKYSDKPYMGIVTAPERAEDCVKMARILFGDAFIDAGKTVMASIVNCNSPMVWDESMLSALRVYARANQAVLVTPFIMAGAMAPASTAGAIAQLNAEALAGIAYGQLERPGSPMIYGSFVTTVSMQSGAPMMGTAEPSMMIYACCQLARRYKLPVRTGGMLNGSKVADAQAAYESMQTMIPTLMAGTNFVMHTAGWLEAGLSAGYAKFMLDVDQLASLQIFAEGPDLSDEALALEAVREVGPGGHYLGCATPSAISRPPSTLRPSPTITATSSGRPKAPATPTSAPPTAPARCCSNTRPRPSTPRSTKPCSISSPARRRGCRTRCARDTWQANSLTKNRRRGVSGN